MTNIRIKKCNYGKSATIKYEITKHDKTIYNSPVVELLKKFEQLEKQLEIAIKALKEYTIKEWAYEDEYNNYPLGTGGWYHAHEALKQIKELNK